MEIDIRTDTEVSKLEVAEKVFGTAFNEPLVHQVLTAFLAGARMGSRAHKSRAQVSGGGAKPWRQKGTGRARAGSSRSPIWRGGGKTFAAIPVSYDQKVNRKMYRGAIRSIVSELIRQERVIVVPEFVLQKPKTKELVQLLRNYGVDEALIVTSGIDENITLAARNLPSVDVVDVSHLNPVSLLSFKTTIITVDAVRLVEERVS